MSEIYTDRIKTIILLCPACSSKSVNIRVIYKKNKSRFLKSIEKFSVTGLLLSQLL